MPRPLPNPSAKRSRAGSKRRAAGWMLLTLGALVAGVWVVSRWWWFGVTHRVLDITVNRGIALFETPGLHWIEPHAGPFVWFRLPSGLENLYWSVPAFAKATPGSVCISGLFYAEQIAAKPNGVRGEIALWPLPLLLWTPGALALWSGRRARRRALEDHCPTCGYNLAGLKRDAGGLCPECGTSEAAP